MYIDSIPVASKEATPQASSLAVKLPAAVKISRELHADRQHSDCHHRGHAACLVVGNHTAGREEDQQALRVDRQDRRREGHAAYFVAGGNLQAAVKTSRNCA